MNILCANVARTSEVFAKLNRKCFSNFKLTLAIAKLSKELESHKEFVGNEERKILLKYMKKTPDGKEFLFDKDGNCQLEDPKKIVDLNRDLGEFHKNSLEIKSIESKLVFTTTNGLEDLTPQDIMVLDPFVEFVLEDDVNQKENTQA